MNDGPSWESQDIPCSQTDRKLFAAATKITVGDGSKTSFWDSGWRWSSISNPAQHAKKYPAYPVLMSIICSSSAGTFKLFDPIIEKEYTLKNSSLVPCDDYFQMLLFAKHGWVLVLRGNKYMYATNPFTGEMLELPEMPWLGHQFDGISFSSSPKSPDCVVCAVEKERRSENILLYVMVWHAGDDHWTRVKMYDHTQFRTAYSNPVFYRDKFYCLGTRGNLGVFNPQSMKWRVLDKPGAIPDDDPMP
uniref:KIB1-4 beta-propeller domain-containing protein n=1 Tax=Setaria italica TaxID=4555 RepID=K3YXV5_SETIT